MHINRGLTQLGEVERRWFDTMMSIGDAVITTDENGQVDFMNSVAESVTGWAFADALHKPVQQVHSIRSEDPRQPMGDPVLQAFQDGGVVSFSGDARLVRKDGSEIFIEDNVSPIRQADGKIIGTVIIFRDATTRRQAEERLRYQATLLNTAHDPIFVRNTADEITFWNRGAEETYGWTRLEAIGRVSHELLKIRFPRPLAEIMREAEESGEWSGELTHTAKGGREIPVASRWALQRDIWGRHTATLEINRDITEIKKMEEAQAQLAAIVDHSEDAIFGKTLAGIITSWNLGAQKMYGFSPEEVVNRPVSILMPPGRKGEMSEILRVVASGAAVRDYETVRMKKDGTIFDVSITVSPVKTLDGTVMGASTIAHDITGRKRLEQEIVSQGERLAEERNLLRSVINNMPFSFVLYDAGLRVEYANNFVLRRYGFTPEAITGKTIHELFSDEICTIFDRIFERVLRFREPVGEEINYHIAGKPVTGIAHAIPIFSNRNHVTHVLVLFIDITERKRMEQELELTARHRQLALDAAGLGWWQYDPASGVANWDGRFRDIFGISEWNGPLDEILADLVHPDDRAIMQEGVRAALNPANPQPYRVEHRVIRPDKTMCWVEANGLGIFVGEGKNRRASSLIGVVADVTERKNADQAVRESEERFHTLANAIPQLAWIADGDGNIHWYNRRWYEYTGTTPEQMVGLGWQSVHDPEMLPAVLERWKHSLATGEIFGMEFPLRGADGIFRPFLTQAMPLKDAQGKVVQWFGTNTDLSELRKAEAAIARLSAIVENSADAIIGKSLDNIITSWNEGATRLYGYSMGEAVGKPVSLILGPGQSDEISGFIDHVRSGESVLNYETVRVKKDGSTVPVSLTISPIRDASGSIVGTSTIARDLTERHLLEEKLRNALTDAEDRARELAATNLELQAFSYSVAHDLRNPLQVISGFVDLLEGECINKACFEYIGRIKTTAEKMSAIIEDILALSKISRQEVRVAELDLSELARNLVREHAAAHPDRTVRVTIGENLRARGDARLMSVALENLLSNAWKYTAKTENPEIEFGAFDRDGKRIFFVRDNGVGFDMSKADRLFLPFNRLHSEKEFPGTGIGLATVERAITRQGGRIWAESEPGRGATFYFTLGERGEAEDFS